MNELEALRRTVEDMLREAQKDERRRYSAYLAGSGRLPEWRYSVGYADGLRKALAVFPSMKPGGTR